MWVHLILPSSESAPASLILRLFVGWTVDEKSHNLNGGERERE